MGPSLVCLLAFVIGFCSCSPTRVGEGDLCIELTPETSNQYLATKTRASIQKILADAPHSHKPMPVMEPYNLDKAGPYEIPVLLGLTATNEVFNVTINGFQSLVVKSVSFEGTKIPRKVTATVFAPIAIFKTGKFRVTEPIHVLGEFHGHAKQVSSSVTAFVEPGVVKGMSLKSRTDGEVDVVLKPDLPITDHGIKIFVQNVVKGELRILMSLFLENAYKTKCN